MNRRQYLASLALPLLPMTATALNPKRLPVLKLEVRKQENGVVKKLIMNDVFGKMPWKKMEYNIVDGYVLTGEYPHDKPMSDQTNWTADNTKAVRETPAWLDEKDKLHIHSTRKFFWGEVLVKQDHRGRYFFNGTKTDDMVSTTIMPTENSTWVEIKSEYFGGWELKC